jgi:hypothetical protein
MKYLLIIIFTFSFYITYGQDNKLKLSSTVLTAISGQWKIDSFGTNGYRNSVLQQVQNCKVDSITKSFLFAKLGKPQHRQMFYVGVKNKWYVGFKYNVLNRSGNENDTPFQGSYVQFVFDEHENLLIEITTGEVCN